jgi:type VI secretion system protein ImpM
VSAGVNSARLFGKLPAHGDFVARGLGAAEREALDAWLSAEMLAAREALGSDFENRYDRAPPWRFAGPDGTGVLVASVDGVGRRFPLYLALSIPFSSPARGRWQAKPDGGGGKQTDNESDAPSTALAENTAEQVEDLVYRAFAENWDADALFAEACSLAFSAESIFPVARWWTLGGEGFVLSSLDGERPEGLLAKMLNSEVNA